MLFQTAEDNPIWTLRQDPFTGLLFSGGADGYLRGHDLIEHRERFRLDLGSGWINGIATSYDGFVVASTSGGVLHKISLHSDTWECFDVGPFWINGIELRGGREALCATAESEILMVAMDDCQKTHRLGIHREQVWSVVLSSDGNRLVSAGGGGEVALWDANHMKFLKWVSRGGSTITSVTWLGATGLIGAASLDGSVRVWDVKTGRELRNCCAHRERIWSMAADPDRSIVMTAGADGSARFWSMGELELLGDWKFGKRLTACCLLHTGGFGAVGTREGDLSICSIEQKGNGPGEREEEEPPVVGPTWAPEESMEVIAELLANNHVVLFLRGTAASPKGPFSAQAARALREAGIAFRDVDVTKSEDLKNSIKRASSFPLFPQLFVGGRFIGTSDVIPEMLRTGALHRLVRLYSGHG